MQTWRALGHLAVGASLLAGANAQGIDLDVTDENSLKAAAKLAAGNMMASYTGNQPGQVPGLLPAPYYWWEAGAMFGQLMAYANLTGDHQYDDIVKQAMLFQVGDNDNYMPTNQSKDLGNDDQVFWAFSAMDAAELGFENPGADQPSWLGLAQAVFNTQVPRWETSTCGGGLRWQIYPFNTGYNYKNTISNSCFFATAARLGRYTGNQTYFDWANRSWNWMERIGVMSADYHFYDGTDSNINCSQVNHIEWTYNTGVSLYGAAIMYNAVRFQSPPIEPC
jgi:mannan endo-1,6-alpha-mannosidase